MKKRYLEAAKITKTVGLRGEMRARLFCDSEEVLVEFDLYLDAGNNPDTDRSPLTVESAVSVGGDMCKIRIKGIDSIEAADKLVGKTLYIDRYDTALPEDSYFIADIIGLSVYDADDGRFYGKVCEILQNGPTDIYVLKSEDGRELMFPSIPEILIKTELEKERIEIRPIEGLFEN